MNLIINEVDAFEVLDSRGNPTGLAIALWLVQGHGGSLTLSNRPEGGLRATITLPVGSS